ncbi:Hypothetical predicted protein [Cloeon dipterum]|uniref:Histone-lysine N-methyltransferase n=1 Tax=Cloeon dipterum TaxID=197152 RepID=A0A8S1CZU9_9INSE|nr:Hypothetical predicted protein [Cloeon dipterum]
MGKSLEYHVVFCGKKHLRSWIGIKHLAHCETLADYNNLLENCKEKQNPFQVLKKFKNDWKVSLDEMLRVKSEDRSLILEMYEVKQEEPKRKLQKITPEEKQQLRVHLHTLRKAEREELKKATKMRRAKMIELKRLRKQKLLEELRRIRAEAKGHITRTVCFKCRDHNDKTAVVRCSQCDYFYHHTCEPVYTPDSTAEAFVCTYCKTATMPCHICYTHSPDMLKCRVKRCQKLYHATCLDFKWQQASILDGNLISCPAHSCHSCIHRSIVEYKKKIEPREKLVRCTVCPGTYHKDEECIPAGAVRINSHQILCPRHVDIQNKPRTYLCQICVKPFTNAQFEANKVRSCQTCPCLYHLDCLDEEDEQLMAADQFVCIYCRDGFFPRAGDVVWAKCGSSRWWPAKVLSRSAYPENMLTVKHTPDMFIVRFYGTNDHYWVSNKSTFLLQNEDDVASTGSSSSKDQKFQKGLEEAIQEVQSRELYFDTKVPLHYDSGMDKKPGNYRRIKNNIYVKPSRPLKEMEDFDETCRCNPEEPDPCGDGCVNKGLKIECSKECPCKELCQNQRMQRHQNAPTELKHMGTKGWGLTALQDLKQGTFVIEYVGEVLTKEEFQRRKQEYINNKERHFYFLELSGNHFIDARNKGNLSRFINHSCEPNCESSHWMVSGERRVGLFTLRDVKAGEELTFNYGWRSDGSNNQQCLCGAESCSKSLAMEKLKKGDPSLPSKPKGKVSMSKKKAEKSEEPSTMTNCDVCSSKFVSSKDSVICGKCYEEQEF